MDLEHTTALVTGGAGFIGSHLVQTLLQLGVGQVRVIDNFSCGSQENLTSGAPPDPRLLVFPLDLAHASQEQLTEALAGVTHLFHLAAEKHQQSRNNPQRVLSVNINGTQRLLEAAAQAQVEKVIFTSSLYVYGRMAPPAMAESEIPAPSTIYGISKLAGEHLMAYAAKQFGLRFSVFRLFFVYGPRQFAGMGYKSVILKNFERIRAGQPPLIFGDGLQALDYVYMEDVIRALVQGLHSSTDGLILNIGTGKPTTIQHLIETMLSVAKSPLRPQEAPPDWTAGSCRVGDVSLAQQTLGWQPKTELYTGLSHVYHWMCQNPPLENSECSAHV